MDDTTHKLKQGLVQVYTGNGKGKTTASLGLALRAAGHGFKVYIIQFLKGGKDCGELKAARRLAPELTIEQVGRGIFLSRCPDEIDVRMARDGFAKARKIVLSGDYDLVVLDELNCALDFGLIPLAEVKDMIVRKAPHTELVITGRWAHPDIIKLADLVTEMRAVKHYYRSGQRARRGIEL